MQKFTNILVFSIALLLVIFVIQNYIVTTVKVLFWNIDGSLSVILFIVLLLGFTIGYLISLPATFKRRRQIKEMGKKIRLFEQNRNTNN